MSLCANISMPATMLADLKTYVVGIILTLDMAAGCQVQMFQHKVCIRKLQSHFQLLLLILSALCLLERQKLVASECTLTAMQKSKRKVNQMEEIFLKKNLMILGSMPTATISLSIHSLKASSIRKFLKFYGASIGSRLCRQALC